MERISPMTRLALDERPGMIRSLASLDIPIDYPFAQTIAYGWVPARVPVKAAENAIRAQRLWDMVVDSYRRPLDTEQIGKYAALAHVEVDPDKFTGNALDIIRKGWGESPLLASTCASHRLLADGEGVFDPAGLTDGRCADVETICRRCIRRPSDGLTDEERARVYDA